MPAVSTPYLPHTRGHKVLETKPSAPIAKIFPPDFSKPHPITTGDSWRSVASEYGLDVWNLIEFNFAAVMLAPSFRSQMSASQLVNAKACGKPLHQRREKLLLHVNGLARKNLRTGKCEKKGRRRWRWRHYTSRKQERPARRDYSDSEGGGLLQRRSIPNFQRDHGLQTPSRWNRAGPSFGARRWFSWRHRNRRVSVRFCLRIPNLIG